MSSLNIDLDENNYDYDALLNLFSLKSNFDKQDLKIAKRKVMKLHPDSSGLPRGIFIFMIKMYCKLEEIHNYTIHEENKDKLTMSFDVDDKFKNYLDENNINPVKNYKLFSQEFNKMFDKVYISDNETGYSDWLKSDEDIYDKDNLEKSRQMAINNEIIKIEDIVEVGDNNFSNGHTDVKEVYSNPFVAMDIDKVYKEKPKFSSIQEYKSFLAEEDDKTEMLTNDASMKYFERKEQLLNTQSKNLAYDRMKKNEEMEKKYKNYVSKYLKLEY